MQITNEPQLANKYGKRADKEFLFHGKPVVSFPFTITEIPEEAQYLSWELVDYDTIPLLGFAFIHWSAANVPVTETIMEDFSRRAAASILQGKNSLASPIGHQLLPVLAEGPLPELTERYLGMSPRSGVHTYTLYVYATKEPLDLEPGFYTTQLHAALKGSILAKTKFEWSY